jgi:cell shape-determining protein MreD
MAFVIGAMAVFAGGQVLLGQLPDYYVIDWLPIYNLTLGLVSALFASVVIWRNSRLALPSTFAVFGLHALVMSILLTAYRHVVAVDSLRAMTIRLAVWVIILILLLAARRNRP